MKKIVVIGWLTVLCFILLGNVHAWEVPSYMRISGGARMWFSSIEGDLIQANRTKLGLAENLGLKKEKLVWEFYTNLRLDNIHLFRFKIEPFSLYDQSRNDSYQQIRTFQFGYDLDFFMTPQILFGANIDLNLYNLDTRVNKVTVGAILYDYQEKNNVTVPTLGIHGTFYPILSGVALRPNITGRVNWWNYDGLETWDWEVSGAVDIPINRLWTWSVNGGYRYWHLKTKREIDTADLNRMGFFIEASLMF